MTLAYRLFAQSVRDMRAMPAPDIEAAGASLLGRLLEHAGRHVPGYRALAPLLEAAARGDRDAWASLPTPTDDALRRAGAAGLADALPPDETILDERSWTSIATPIDGAYGILADIADRAQWEYLLRGAGVDTSARLAAILPAEALRLGDLAEPFGPWSLDAQNGRAHLWSEEFEAEATLAWLGHVRPACLFLRPAILEGLLAAPHPGRLALADILLAGPARDPDAATRCRETFGARLLEAVVSSAGGFVAGAGTDERFAPAQETAFVEIVDRKGAPARAGESGRLLATALYGYRRPVIRHDLGITAAWCDAAASDATHGRACFTIFR